MDWCRKLVCVLIRKRDIINLPRIVKMWSKKILELHGLCKCYAGCVRLISGLRFHEQDVHKGCTYYLCGLHILVEWVQVILVQLYNYLKYIVITYKNLMKCEEYDMNEPVMAIWMSQ